MTWTRPMRGKIKTFDWLLRRGGFPIFIVISVGLIESHFTLVSGEILREILENTRKTKAAVPTLAWCRHDGEGKKAAPPNMPLKYICTSKVKGAKELQRKLFVSKESKREAPCKFIRLESNQTTI